MIENPAAGATGTTFREWVNGSVIPIVDQGIIPLLYALAFLFFMYGVARFFFSTNEEKRTEGRKFAIWGIVGFVVLFSLWGMVNLLLSVLSS